MSPAHRPDRHRRIPAALLVGVPLGALAFILGAQAAPHEIIREPGETRILPGPVVVSSAPPVLKTPAACVTALATSDQLLAVLGAALKAVQDGNEAMTVAQKEQANRTLDDATTKLGPLLDRYETAKAACRAS